MAYLLGIDLGTSSVKSIMMDQDGKIRGIGRAKYDVSNPQPGYAEQDAEILWQAAADSIRQALAESAVPASEIRGIGFSGQMHGLVLLNKEHMPSRPVIIHLDQRTQPQIDQIYQIVGKDNCRNTIGNSLSTGFLLCSLLWVRDHEPEMLEQASVAFLPKDYIRFKLCGEFGTDVTDASATAAFDVGRRCWADEIINILGLPWHIFPKVGGSHEIAGQITAEAAAMTGLAAGTPVVYGGGDSMMHSVGNGIIRPGRISVNIGTAAQVSSAINQPKYDPQFRTNTFCHADDDLWIIFSGHLNGGTVLKWVNENFFPKMSFPEMDDAAAQVPAGCENALLLPYLSGERTPWQDPAARAIFYGLTPRHNYRHMIRAAMEGVTLAMRLSFDILGELNIPVEQVISSGGGAKSSLWRQIQADVFNRPIHTVAGAEEACMGAAIMAGIGTGVYPSLETACDSLVRYNTAVTEPIPENVKTYEALLDQFRDLYLMDRAIRDKRK